jgi:hypothetical protein
MRIEDLKRWQWAIFGAVAGLMLGWAWCGLANSEGLSDAVTLGAEQFERGLAAKPLEGHPHFKNITLHRRADRDFIVVKVLEPDPKDPHPNNPRHYRYVRQQLNPTRPFLPSFRQAPTQTAMVRINPSAISAERSLKRHEDSGPLPLWINGAAVGINELGAHLRLKDWKIETGHWADPEKGAELGLLLRPADYQMLIVLSTSQEKLGPAADLTVALNGHALPQPRLVQKSSGASLETTVPHEAFGPASAEQVVTFSRKGEPVRIWEVRLINPNYSIADYLAYVHATHPEIALTTAWWDSNPARYAIACVSGIVFFAGVFPILIQLFTGARLGKSVRGDEYDLSRFKGEPEKQTAEQSATEDELGLDEREEELKKGLAARAEAAESAKQDAAAPVALRSEPVAAVSQQESEAAEYKGEFYPVVKRHK